MISTKRYLWLLAAVAFLVRLALALALTHNLNEPPTGPSTADTYEFNTLAENVAQGHGFANHAGRLTSFRAPGFPYFLGAFYMLVGGPNYLLARLLFCVLGALACVFTYLIAREVLPENGARLAGWLSVPYLGHACLAADFLSENLFTPLFLASLWPLFRYFNRSQDNIWLVVLSAVLMGLSTLTRPFTLLMVPLMLLLLLFVRGGRVGRMAVAAAWVVPFILLIAPWTVRNYQVHQKFVLIATNGGSTFYGGNNDRVVDERSRLGAWLSTTELPHRDLIDAQPNEVAHDKMEWKLGIAWVRQHPVKFLITIPFKLARLLLALPDVEKLGKPLRALAYLPYVVLFLAGFWVCFRQKLLSPPWMAVHTTLAATIIMTMIFWGSARFRDANLGLLAIYASVGLTYLRGLLFRRSKA